MNEKIIIVLHAIIFILLVSLVFVNFDFSKDSILKNETIKTVSIDHLKGTCPQGRSCLRPTCSLWSDINHDGVCDRS